MILKNIKKINISLNNPLHTNHLGGEYTTEPKDHPENLVEKSRF